MKKTIPSYLRVLVIFFTIFGAMEYFIDSGDRPAFIKFPMVLVFLLIFIFLLIAIETTLTAVETITYLLLTEEEKVNLEIKNNQSFTDSKWYENLKNKFTNSNSDRDEALLLLDHDYDGIKELDNKLPPWWVYLFYACIVFAVVYMVRFEIMGADDQEMELKNEMVQAQIDVAKYLATAPDLMDEKTVTLLTGSGDIALGKEIFATNCAACHRADAGGQIGPNLTDDRWVLGGGIKNIFHTILTGGRDGKGMISWKGTLKPKEMQKVASYIISLSGTNPKDPKAAEGEIWVDKNVTKLNSPVVEIAGSLPIEKSK